MNISQKDLKKLWGLSAGRCSHPDCNYQCVNALNKDADDEHTIIGEMAHIIAQSPSGPRGQTSPGKDIYENLILLCPTHHREIDKSPEGTFSIEEIHEWKNKHEKRVRDSLEINELDSIEIVARTIKKLLIQNHSIWKTYGPESDEAISNPLSSAYKIWELRKLDTIVVNNKKIINTLESTLDLFNLDEYPIIYEFIEHASGFESNCYERKEGVKRFPIQFSEVIDKYVK